MLKYADTSEPDSQMIRCLVEGNGRCVESLSRNVAEPNPQALYTQKNPIPGS